VRRIWLLTLTRWVARGALPRLGVALAPAWTALGFGVVQADAVVDWSALARDAAALGPGRAAALAFGLSVLTAPGAAAALRFALYAPPLAAAWRQPVGARAWAIALAGPALIAVAPLILALGFFGPAVALVGGVAAAGVALALASGGWARAALWGSAVAVGAAAADVSAALGIGVVAGLMAASPTVASEVVAGVPVGRRGPRPVRWRPRGPVSALLLRDGLALLRTAPGALVVALAAAAPAYGAQTAVRVNNDFPADLTARAAVWIVVGLSPVALAGCIEVAKALGGRFDPPEWPVGPVTRALSVAAGAGVLSAPVALAVVLAGTNDGGRGLLRVGTAWAALATGQALVICAPRRHVERGHAHGPWLFAMIPLAIVFATPGYGGAAAAVVVAGLALPAAAARLAAHRRSTWS
jgi:hypothetical protein